MTCLLLTSSALQADFAGSVFGNGCFLNVYSERLVIKYLKLNLGNLLTKSPSKQVSSVGGHLESTLRQLFSVQLLSK